jgi:hypothetical protein
LTDDSSGCIISPLPRKQRSLRDVWCHSGIVRTEKEEEEKIMPKLTKYSDHLGDWASLLAALTENEGNLPHLVIPRDQLQAYLAEANGLTASQAAQAAAKQQTSRRLEEVVNLGSKLANSLRVAVKVVYGNRSEKLTEFHIQPFRGRTRTPETPPVGPEAPAPEESSQ